MTKKKKIYKIVTRIKTKENKAKQLTNLPVGQAGLHGGRTIGKLTLSLVFVSLPRNKNSFENRASLITHLLRNYYF
jgi:hypothetical protein